MPAKVSALKVIEFIILVSLCLNDGFVVLSSKGKFIPTKYRSESRKILPLNKK